MCIKENRYKYSSHGREANKSLDDLLVPDYGEIPKWTKKIKTKQKLFSDITLVSNYPYRKKKNKKIRLYELFTPKNGLPSSVVKRENKKISKDYIHYIRPSKNQVSSVDAYVNKFDVPKIYIFPKETLYVSTDGQGSHTYAYVSTFSFVPNSNITVLIPNREMSLQEKVFYSMIISKNRFKFSYGIKPKGKRLLNLEVPLFPRSFIFNEGLLNESIKDIEIDN